jgi:zinc transport system permease protein
MVPPRSSPPTGTTRRMSILDADFMRVAFATGAVVGVLAPAVGFFLVQRQMSLIGDGIGHAAFAGVAAGYLIDVSPVGAALVAATLAAVGVEWLRSRHRAAGDQALALVFYTGIAAGVVLVSAAGALNANLFTFLFGSILTVTWSDFALVAILGAVGLGVVAVLYRGLVAVSLDEEGARVSGLPVSLLNVSLAALAGVTIAISMRIVGILLIAALMVLPVIAAGRVARSIRSTILLSMGVGLVSVAVGLVISFYGNLAPGGAIVLLAAGFAVLALAGSSVVDRAR